jgi:hypothetical protein
LHRNAWAEHVVLCVGDSCCRRSAGRRVQGSCDCLLQWRVGRERVHGICRPSENLDDEGLSEEFDLSSGLSWHVSHYADYFRLFLL